MTKADKKILHTVLEQTAKQFPDHTAVEHGDRSLSYGALHDAADRLAVELQARGAGRNTIVALYFENSLEFVVAMLGVMKAGAIFMPLDVSFPVGRIQMILDKTTPDFLLKTADTEFPLPRSSTIPSSMETGTLQADLVVDWTTLGPDFQLLPDKPDGISRPDDGNYIFFTSGSTGDAKAITGCQKSLSHFVHWEAGEFDFDTSTRVSQLAPVSFDACLKDIFTPLLKGGTVCIPEKHVRGNISILLDWIHGQGITVVHCVPSLFRALLTELESRSADPGFQSDTSRPGPRPLTTPGFWGHLKHLILAGDAVYGKDVNRWMDLFEDRIELVNLYGPTETTLVKTCHRIKQRLSSPGAMVHVGHPISNTAVLIIKGNRLCDMGEIGDIYIKTPFMTKGYYNDPDMTRACFLENPTQADPEDIVYRTGDLGRYLPDRSIEFIGRLDNQVKVNGVRMDFAEIEQVLAGMPGLGQAVVQAHRNVENENVLVCYYMEEHPVNSGMIRDYLVGVLPSYMLPAYYLSMDELPLNLNGKVNRKALPKPEELLYADTVVVAPANGVEKKLVAIWQEILGLHKVSVESPFFEIGGHSLKAVQIVSRVYKVFNVEIRLKDFFDHPTIRQQALLLDRSEASAIPAIDPAPILPLYDLSHAQHRLWILSQMDAEGTAHSMPGVYLVNGPLHKGILEKAFEILVVRHESLRTIFPVVRGEPRQKILPASPEGFPIHEIHVKDPGPDALSRPDASSLPDTLSLPDTSSLPDGWLTQGVAPHVAAELARPFELARGPLVRTTLITLGGDRRVLVFNMHHIISDAWSVDVIARELFSLYGALQEDPGVPLPELGNLLPELKVQYKDFMAWQNRFLASKAVEKHADYWRTKLAGRLPVLDLPLDYPRPPVPRYQGRTEWFMWEAPLVKRIAAFSREHRASLFMTLMTGVKILLYRYSDQTDGIVGTPMTQRDHPDLEHQVGFYVNTLALRDEVLPEASFRELLARVKQTILDAHGHQAYPFDLLVQGLDVARDVGRAPVFDVMVVFQENNGPDLEMGNITFTEMDIETETAQFDLTLIFKETEEGLKIGLNYNTDLFKKETIQRMAGHLKNLFLGGLSTPDAAVADIDLLMEHERRQLTIDFRGGRRPYPSDQSLVDLFNAAAERFHDRTAVVFEDRTLTYGELHRRANALALYLMARIKIGPGDLVGLMMDRSDHSVLCLLAILKAGGVCVNLDPFYPPERVGYMLKNSGCRWVMVDSMDRHGRLVPDHGKNGYQVLEADQLTKTAPWDSPAVGNLPRVESRDPACVFYTSGSTGTPKGVLLEHRGYVNMVMGLMESYGITPSDRILQSVSYAFDVSMSEIFSALLSGACLVVANRARIDHPKGFVDYLNRHGVTLAMLTPAYVNALDRDGLKNLRVLITGGEPPEKADAAYYSRSLACFNGYGPTEASVYATLYRIDPERDYSLGIPIGKPMPNTVIHILDERHKLVPVGVPGEICIGGTGLARNYLDQPEMTAERFVPNPFGNGRLYHTGDLGRWLPDGNILFMGRRDEQIKIRGHRVEPGEIENRLRLFPGVQKAVVVKIGEQGQQKLAAYLVVGSDSNVQELKAYLSRYLPDYMIPSFFTCLGEFPQTPTGKIDKKALPPPDAPPRAGEPAPPGTPLEERLLSIFQEILGTSAMGIFDNFFDLGGTSLSAVKLAGRVFNELNINVSARQLFLNPTVATFAPALTLGPDAMVPPDPPDICTRASHTTMEPRSLIGLISDKIIAPMDAAALEYLPDDLVPSAGQRDKAGVLEKWCNNAPVLTGVIETALGRVGMITLPCFASDLFQDGTRVTENVLAALELAALELAARAGARAVSMTGLLPSATRQGQAVMDRMVSGNGLPALTTSQASVAAVMVMTVEKLLGEAHRSMAGEHLGIIGCDMQGQAMVKLMLDTLPHPRAITLCGVYQDKGVLDRLASELSSESGFNGELGILTARPDVPPEFYGATLMVGATSATGIIDIQVLRPGTLLVSDPARPCFDPESAFNRFESQQDILFAEGDLLTTGTPCRRQIHLTEEMAAQLPPAHQRDLLQADPNIITGCVLSGLFSVCDPEIPVTVGDLDLEICRKHLFGIKKLGFEAASPRYGRRVLGEGFKEQFRARPGTIKK
ncbi:MAG: amino acid adenylation domain-containing protein [Desulfobacterium sp.]|nr:amino acid adenylation domain-containing protein [Desulfobacterium sp.]